jgi:hypothetical protein
VVPTVSAVDDPPGYRRILAFASVRAEASADVK